MQDVYVEEKSVLWKKGRFITLPALRAAPSTVGEDAGYGIFAEQRIIKGDVVSEFYGLVRKRDVCSEANRPFLVSLGSEYRELVLDSRPVVGDPQVDLCARLHKVAGLANSSLSGNSKMERILFRDHLKYPAGVDNRFNIVSDQIQGSYGMAYIPVRVVLIATRNISVGDEITFNYRFV